MTSGSPQYAVAVLNSFALAYLRHNVEKRSDEAEKTLKFLDAQIPVLRENLEVAEKALERYKVEEGTAGVDLTLATSSTLEKSADLEKRLSEMELQRKELLFRFTGTHPVLQALNEKVAFLRAERDAINEQIAQLPEAESTSRRLRREVTVATGLYLALLNRSQELKITKSGLTGNVRVLDFAVTLEMPINPKTGQKVAFALAAGLLGGILLAIARKSLHQGLIDPSEVERASGLIVRASIPHSDRQVALEKERRTRKSARLPVLAETDPTDMAAESEQDDALEGAGEESVGGAEPAAPPRPEGDEVIEVVTVPLETIPALISSGRITHALVSAAFHLLSIARPPAR